MKCQKCGAGNLEDAEFCSLCFERFKPKAPAKAPAVLVADVTIEFGYWETAGPLLITREMVLCFAKTCTDVTEKKSMKGQIHKNLSEKGLLGAALGAALGGMFEEKRPLRPEEIHLKTVHWEKEPLLNFAEHKVAVGPCDEYFILEKKDITAIRAKFPFRLQFTTAAAEFITSFIEQDDLLLAFLKSSGYRLQ